MITVEALLLDRVGRKWTVVSLDFEMKNDSNLGKIVFCIVQN